MKENLMKKRQFLVALMSCFALLMIMGIASGYAASSMNLSVTSQTQSIGSSVKVNVSSADEAPNNQYQYKYVWSYNDWTDWGVLKNYSTETSLSFNPSIPGKYTIYVDRMDKNGNVVTVSKPINLSIGWSAKVSASSPNKLIGSKITTKTDIVNPLKDSQYKYKFVWSLDNWKHWGVIRNFSSTNQADFTPTKPGKYTMYVDIQDKYGNIVVKSYSIDISKGWSSSLVASASGSLVGSTIQGKANTSSSLKDAGIQYKFVWSKNDWEHWGVLKQFGSSTEAAFKSDSSGKYTLYMDVKDKYGNVETHSKSFYLSTDWRASTPTVNMNGTTTGSKIDITANSTKYLAGARYKFVWSYNNWAEWGIISNFTNNKSASFYPNKPGTYTIYTDIMDAYGSVNTASKSFSIKQGTQSYKLVINLNTQTVSAHVQNYDGSYGGSVRNMPCSTGKSPGSTPSGTFPLKTKYRWHTLMGGVKGQWCSRIVGGVLFHSIPYRSTDNRTLITKYYNQLGAPASAGCVRLRAIDAKWIYDNCPEGTPVQIGSFNWPNLPGKVYPRRIKSSTTWDPTDPTLGSQYYDKGWQ